MKAPTHSSWSAGRVLRIALLAGLIAAVGPLSFLATDFAIKRWASEASQATAETSAPTTTSRAEPQSAPGGTGGATSSPGNLEKMGAGQPGDAGSEPNSKLMDVCVQLAQIAPEMAASREKGITSIEQQVMIRQTGGSLVLRDLSDWMVDEIYTTLRYVPPDQIVTRVVSLCKGKFG